MSWLKLPLVCFLLISTFGYGIGVGLYRWFPFDEIKALKNTFIPSKNKITDESLPREIGTINKQLTAQEAIELRASLLQAIVPTHKLDVSISSDEGFEIIETTYYGLSVRGEFYKASSQSKCLRIYIHGHKGKPNDYKYHNELRDEFLSNGCDMLSLSMIGIGLNNGAASFPARFGTMELNKVEAADHANYSFFYDVENPYLDALSLFLYPHMRLIEHAIKQGEYENSSIIGISGGGWYTVWLSALMPELDTSVSYAGSVPMAYRKLPNNHGDWEQVYSPLYRKVSYLQLYQLMLLDKVGIINRQSFLIYNSNDTCCFMNPVASNFKARIGDLKFYPQVIVHENSSHEINLPIVLDILQH